MRLLQHTLFAPRRQLLVDALQRAGKPFELMLYPRSRHGVSDPLLVKHMRTLMLERTYLTNLLATVRREMGEGEAARS